MPLSSKGLSTFILLDKFSLIAERNVATTPIDMRISSKDSMHIPSCASLGPLLEGLRERMLLIGLSEHITIFVPQYLAGIDTAKSEIRKTINISKEVLSPPCMFEGLSQQFMKLLIISVKRVNIVVIVVFETIPLIHLWREVTPFNLQGFKFS